MRREFTTRERRAEKTRARAGQGARNGLQEIPGFRSLLRLTAVCYSALDVSSFRGWCASQTSFTFDPRERFGYRFYWSTGDELGGGGEEEDKSRGCGLRFRENRTRLLRNEFSSTSGEILPTTAVIERHADRSSVYLDFAVPRVFERAIECEVDTLATSSIAWRAIISRSTSINE